MKYLLCSMLLTLFACGTQLHAKSLKICIEEKIYNTDRMELLRSFVSQGASENQFEAQFVSRSWPRCLIQVSNGEVDAIMGIIYTPERALDMVFPPGAELAKPSHYLWQARYPFFIKKGHKLSLAKGFKPINGIGTPYKYLTYNILKQKKLLPVYDYDLETGLKMVAAGRLDAYVIETQTGLNALKKLQLEKSIEHTDEILLERYGHFAVNPDYYLAHTQQVDKLWSDLAKIRSTVIANDN